MKKFINSTVYGDENNRQQQATEILVKDGVIEAIGNNLPSADEEID